MTVIVSTKLTPGIRQDMARANPDRQKEMATKLQQGKFSIRDWREQLSNMMNMGSLSKITSMIPGMSGMMEDGGEEEAASKLKRMIFITDAMRADELDSDGLIFVSIPPIRPDWIIKLTDPFRSALTRLVTRWDSTVEPGESPVDPARVFVKSRSC